MNNLLVIIGAVVLIGSVLGLSHTNQQQLSANQTENTVDNSRQNQELLNSASMIGVPIGIILIIIGLIPPVWYRSD